MLFSPPAPFLQVCPLTYNDALTQSVQRNYICLRQNISRQQPMSATGKFSTSPAAYHLADKDRQRSVSFRKLCLKPVWRAGIGAEHFSPNLPKLNEC